jgi:hypothetical protein
MLCEKLPKREVERPEVRATSGQPRELVHSSGLAPPTS